VGEDQLDRFSSHVTNAAALRNSLGEHVLCFSYRDITDLIDLERGIDLFCRKQLTISNGQCDRAHARFALNRPSWNEARFGRPVPTHTLAHMGPQMQAVAGTNGMGYAIASAKTLNPERHPMSDETAKLSFWAALTLFALCPLTLQAQATTASKKPLVVTGCLQKSDEPGEFSITGDDGKTWDLRSRTVKLSQHVGHKVSVTGVLHHETKAEEAKEEKTEKKEAGERENADLRVTRLKMISKTCGPAPMPK